MPFKKVTEKKYKVICRLIPLNFSFFSVLLYAYITPYHIDGKTGFLVPPADFLSLAKAIITLLKYKTLAKNMGNVGRKRTEPEFSLDKMIKTNEKLYQLVIETRDIRGRTLMSATILRIITNMLIQWPSIYQTMCFQ